MSTVVAEDQIYDDGAGSLWWVFLITGTLWLILSLVMFRFNISSVNTIGVLAGIGESYFHLSRQDTEAIAQALESDDSSAITLPIAREFRTFCERAGDDLKAMAACMRRRRRIFTAEELGGIGQPVLVVTGAEDTLAGSPEPLTRAFPNGESIAVPKRNHHSTVGDRAYKDAVISFFAN